MKLNLSEDSASPQETKRQRILEGAMAVVLRYGYARTTMDDVAKEVGISRPALYLQFKNKTEIYTALAEGMMGQALEGAREALAGPGELEPRVFAAIKTGILDPTDFLMATAHGAELLDMKHNMAADVLAAWRVKKTALLSEAFETSGVAKTKGLSGQMLADMLLDGIEGLKMRAKTSEERSAGARALVRLVVR
jgi:AcrR family transcriptional regulator